MTITRLTSWALFIQSKAAVLKQEEEEMNMSVCDCMRTEALVTCTHVQSDRLKTVGSIINTEY